VCLLPQVPLLLSGLSQRPSQQQAVVLRVVMTALSQLQPAPGGTYSQVTVPSPRSSAGQGTGSGGSKPGVRVVISGPSLLPASAADRQAFLGHALKLLLYQRPSRTGGRATQHTPLGLAAAAAAAATGGAGDVGALTAAAGLAGAGAAPPPPPGLSAADVALLEETGVPEQDALIKQKLGVLCLLAATAAGMPGNAAPAAAASGAGAAAGSRAAAGDSAAPTAAAAQDAGADEMDVDDQQQQQQQTQTQARKQEVWLSSEELLLPLLAAACDPYEAVAR
jgi:hypothetical protein